MQRVLVVGPCGAGKSTLAMELAEKLALPLFHLDKLNWQPGWIESPREELVERIEGVISAERWLLEGTYGSTLAQRLPRADTVVYLDYPISLCLWRLVKRIWHWRGRSRPDMTEGCEERFNLAFFFYVVSWRWGPGKRLEARLAPFANKVIRLKSPAATRRWLSAL
ncbi:P-loop NTPase family protein [Erythrobacter mangrovi]|uniref:Topology modulation protein n=1 Tax=Erythrobacter mangrovi TaxID=2739433 RepID=A0A7D3XS51_9SPHN|nr:topology modulation protein [Erythrobacter mangrovi]QKG71531.1 topology modulation protein [Erythrobacter mangrovi]